MTPKITLISWSPTGQQDASLRWLLAQESPAVQVILLQADGAAFCDALAQVLGHVKGGLFCWLEPGSEFQHPEWLGILHELWQNANVDLLGVRGLAEVNVQSLAAQGRDAALQLSRVLGGGPVNAAGRHGLSVDPVLALGPGMLMGEVSRLVPWLNGLGSLLKPGNIVTFSLLSHIFGGLRLGVVHGMPLLERQPAGDWAHLDLVRQAGGFLPLAPRGLEKWHRNLAALQQTQPDVVTWMAEAGLRSRWSRFDRRDDTRLMLRGERLDAIVVDIPIKARPGDTWCVLGAGTGHAIDTLLRLDDTTAQVLEPDAALMCHLLTRFDWSQAIRESRLHLHCWDESHPVWQQLSGRRLLASFRSELEDGEHPVYFSTGGSFYLNEETLRSVERALHRAWFRSKECAHWRNQRQNAFDVTVVSPQCAIFRDLAECFHRLGYKTRLLNVPDGSAPQNWIRDSRQVLDLLKQGSALTLFRNRSLLESDQWQEPFPVSPGPEDRWVSWWWDMPNIASALEQTMPSQALPALGFARAMLPLLPAGSAWLPPAARMQFCQPEPAPHNARHEVSFVGQSRWNHLRTQLAILRALVPAYLPHGNPLVARWRWNGSAQQLLACLEQDSDWMDMIVGHLREASPAKGYYLDYIWRMVCTGCFRLAAIERLLQAGIPLTVYGDPEWLGSGIVPAANYGGIVAAEALPALYRDTRINLNLNFMQVSSTVNPKVLDIAAGNALVLTDYRPELDELFPDASVRPPAFTNVDSLAEQVQTLLASDTSALAQECGAWVRRHHTMQHRAQWLATRYRL